MKVLSSVLAAIVASSVSGSHQTADIYYHEKEALGPSMWHFSADGLTIYSVDGKQILKAHDKRVLCKPYVSGYSGETVEGCYYFTAATDGHKYVWAGSLAGTNKVEAFDIDTGGYAGYIPTCSTPLDLEYHPEREEMWLRCAQQDSKNGHTGEIDVFSSNSLSSDYDLVFLNETARPYGRIAIHSSLGPFGYVSAYNIPKLSEIDLSTKQVTAQYDLPLSVGSYDMTYSEANRHVFTRGRVSCACEDIAGGCSRPRIVDVLTGPNAGSGVNGTSGSGCEGSLADTIGVFEFDTVNKVIVATHNIKEGTGFGADPVSSPDGKHILLLPNDAGQYVRLLKPGMNGQASEVEADILLDFAPGSPTKSVISDFAFVKDDTRNILVIAAASDNDIVLVDLNNNFKTKKLSLTGAEESTGGGTRDVEWAVGTNYVWVEGSATNEHYVIEIPGASVDDASVSITLADIIGGQLLFVDNYERKRVANLMKETMGEAVKDTMKETIETLLDETLKEAIEETIKDTMKEILEEPDIQKVLVDSINEIIGEDEMQAVVTKTVMTAAEEDIVKDIIRKEQNNGPDAVSVSALVVGSVALFTGIALVVHSSMGVASAAENVLTDDKTLGSKNVA